MQFELLIKTKMLKDKDFQTLLARDSQESMCCVLALYPLLSTGSAQKVRKSSQHD